MAKPSTVAAYSESEEEILNQEEGILAASVPPSGRFPCDRRAAAVACLGVIGLVGVLSLTRGGHAVGTKHLGSQVNLNDASLDFYGSALGLTRETTDQESMPGIAAGATDSGDDSSSFAPSENLHDGNPCDDSEELLGKLCYRKCSLLAPGYPKRTSAWTCCQEPCTWNGWTHDFGVCSGYSVAGPDGTSCPHKPGVCLDNEEMHLGRCFEKCSILTNGEFPHRVAAATCCKADGVMCFNPFNDRTRPDFAVGGGHHDGDPSTPSSMHDPLKSLTEAERLA